jgi:putative nucleotidyltransferase with HDIG domain
MPCVEDYRNGVDKGMGISTCKGIYEIIRRTLSMVNRNIVNHGEVVGYIVSKMLEYERVYTHAEIVNYTMVAMLHDIGMYREENIKNVADFENIVVWEHSVYGYLFLKYFTPLGNLADIVLYHHLAYKKLKTVESKHEHITECLALADQMDTYMQQKSGMMDKSYFINNVDVRFSGAALELFFKADARYGILKHLSDGSYKDEINELLDKFELNERERRAYLDMLVYTIDFRSEFTVIHTMSTVNFAQQLGRLMRLSSVDLKNLYYGALLHDLGKLAIPVEILESPGRLSDADMEIMRSHVTITREILDGIVDDDIRDIAARHHEKLDGSGYPAGLTEKDLTFPQQIVAVADILSALYGKRSYKESFDADKIKDILRSDADNGKISRRAVDCLMRNYDTIIKNYEKEKANTVGLYLMIKQKYDEIIPGFRALGNN